MGPIDVETKRMLLFAVVGKPIGHSLSPQMHRAAFHALGIEAEYLRVECDPHEVGGLAAAVRTGALAGVNITIPHKRAAFELADEASAEAKLLGVANTWVRRDSKVVAYNTDGAGFLMGLRDIELDAEGSTVILGAGGAARAICLALSRQRRRVVVLSRHPDEARDDFRLLGGEVTQWDGERAATAARTAALVVNATPVGMEPDFEAIPAFPLGNLRPDAVVYDIIYRPRRTAWLRAAEARGLRTVDGVRMLAGQGAASLELWLGRPAPLKAMLAALESSLEKAPGVTLE
ncbi:MAG: shikimate dehydrogenase [Fimbriimonadia bacterium]|jgi:shikimate dehydrogenase